MELPTAFSHKERKARKPHQCGECLGFIQPSEMYHHESGIWDGEPDSFKTCDDCYKLKHEMMADLDLEDGMRMEGGIREEFDNSNCPEDCDHRKEFAAIKAKRSEPTQ